jgi:hypothetical protein
VLDLKIRQPGKAHAGLGRLLPLLLAVVGTGAQVWLQQHAQSLVFAEMLLEPWLVLQGLVPYRDFFQHHTPLVTYVIAAVFALSEATAAVVVALHVALVAALTALVILAGARLGGWRPALASGLVYLLLQVPLDGATPWLEPYVAAGLLPLMFLLGPSGVPHSVRTAAAAGVLIGLSILLKQTAVVALVAVGLCGALAVWERRLAPRPATIRLLALGCGALLPLGLALAWFAGREALGPFLYQTGLYNARYVREASQPPTLHDLPTLALMLSLPACALVATLLGRAGQREPPALLAPLLALTGLVTQFPRFADYHYQQALPFTALSAGVLLVAVIPLPSRSGAPGSPVRALLGGLALVQVMAVGLVGLPQMLQMLARPAQEKVVEEPIEGELIAWVQARAEPGEPILVVGDSRLHIATDTLPASRLLYVFPWTYDRSMLLEDIERSRPRIAVVFDGALEDASALEYLHRHYRPVFEATDATVLWRGAS